MEKRVTLGLTEQIERGLADGVKNTASRGQRARGQAARYCQASTMPKMVRLQNRSGRSPSRSRVHPTQMQVPPGGGVNDSCPIQLSYTSESGTDGINIAPYYLNQ